VFKLGGKENPNKLFCIFQP